MGLFGKKNTKVDVDAVQETKAERKARLKAEKAAKKAAKKKGGGLFGKKKQGPDLPESAPEIALDIMRGNAPFVVDHNGTQGYLCLCLHLDDIGGLTDLNDETVGQIIENINKGSIDTFIFKDMFEDGDIIIIPTTQSLNMMEEFSLLAEASYELCVVTDDLQINPVFADGRKTPFMDIEQAAHNISEIENLTDGACIAVNAVGGYDDQGGYDDSYNDQGGYDDGYDEDYPEDGSYDDGYGDDYEGDINYDDYNEDGSMGDGEYQGDYPEDGEFDANVAFDDGSDGEYAEYEEPVQKDYANYDDTGFGEEAPSALYDSELPAPDEFLEDEMAASISQKMEEQEAPPMDEAISEEDVKVATNRVFASGDLGLIVSADPFDMHFVNTNELTLLSENRPEQIMLTDGQYVPDDLNIRLNAMSKAANTRLVNIHNNNVLQMRSRYLNLIEGYCETIEAKLNLDKNTEPADLKKKAEDERDARLARKESEAQDRLREIEENWKADIERARTEAANDAEARFKRTHEMKHNADKQAALLEVEDDIQREFNEKLRQINEGRRKAAAELLSQGISEALETLSEEYHDVLEHEKLEYERAENEINSFLAGNREDEIKRVEILSEHMEQKSLADRVREDMESRISVMTKEFETIEKTLKASVDSAEASKKQALDVADKSWNERMDIIRRENDDLHKQVDRLQNAKSDYEKDLESRYKQKIADLEDDAKRWEKRADMSNRMQSSTSSMMVGVAIVAVIASIAVGFIIGEVVSSKSALSDTQIVVEQDDTSKTTTGADN